ncbi:ABC transporter ATP-binding protein [Oenococcus sp. UCMA 17063]|nr:ABC transporter ATP-binding protein [Oenococcus sp. UCMA 17063]
MRLSKKRTKRISKNMILKVKNLDYSRDDFSLSKISFNLEKGKIYGLIGRNGAGKSTLIRNLLYQPYTLNKSIDYNEEIKNVGFVSHKNSFPLDFTTYEVDKICKGLFPDWSTNNFFKLLTELHVPLKKKIGKMSTGMSAKLNISVCLNRNSELTILDEATSGVDPVDRNEIIEVLKKFVHLKKKSVIIASHILDDILGTVDEIFVMKDGSLSVLPSQKNNKKDILEKM